MPAKPQQMSDSQEKSDDLIAELAKLMASNAQGSESEPKPTVIKLAPLSEATAATPLADPHSRHGSAGAPRQQAPAPAHGADAGCSHHPHPGHGTGPPGYLRPHRSQEARPEPRPQPSAPIDFGKPPTAAPIVVPEPVSDWQAREVPKPVAQTPAQPAAAPAAEPAVRRRPAPLPAKPAAAAADAFTFDFGFGSDAASRAAPAVPHEEAPKAAPPLHHDPIADLIAAELDAAQAEPVAARAARRRTRRRPPRYFRPSVEAVARPQLRQYHRRTGAGPDCPPRRSACRRRRRPRLPSGRCRRPPGRRRATGSPWPRSSACARQADAVARAGPAAGAGRRRDARAGAHDRCRRPKPGPRRRCRRPAAARGIDRDPMDEIESLIGEAVRVELSSADKPAAAAPAAAGPHPLRRRSCRR